MNDRASYPIVVLVLSSLAVGLTACGMVGDGSDCDGTVMDALRVALPS